MSTCLSYLLSQILAISPWNAPGLLSVRAIGVPLICGNAVILKSSEISPMTISIVVDALHEVKAHDLLCNSN